MHLRGFYLDPGSGSVEEKFQISKLSINYKNLLYLYIELIKNIILCYNNDCFAMRNNYVVLITMRVIMLYKTKNAVEIQCVSRNNTL